MIDDAPQPRPRVLVVTSKLDAVGGIARYLRSLIEVLEPIADVQVIDLALPGGKPAQAKAYVSVVARLVQSRPDLLLLGHVGFGPIGLTWQLMGGRFAVMAYGIDVWGPRSRWVTETLLRANAVWPISDFTRIEVLRTAPGANVLPPLGGCIDAAFFQDHDAVTGPRRVLFVASLHDLHYKGADTIVDAVLRVRSTHDVELRVIGEGPATGDLVRFIEQRGAGDCVRMLGRLDDDALREEYRHADVIALLSRYRRGTDPMGEGLGLVVLEAAASSTAAIVSDDGGSLDTVVKGETGYLVTPGDVDGLARQLDGLLENPDELRRLGDAGKQFVLREHSEAAFARRVREALAEVTDRQRPTGR